MREFLRLRLKRHFSRRGVWIKLALLFWGAGMLVFLDQGIRMLKEADAVHVYVEGKVPQQPYESEKMRFVGKKSEAEGILRYEEGWIFQERRAFSKEEEEEIRRILLAKPAEYEEGEVTFERDAQEDHSGEMVLLTLAYFFALSCGSLAAEEIATEKGEGIMGFLLLGQRGTKHLLMAEGYAWICRLSELAAAAAGILAFSGLRMGMDGFAGWKEMIVVEEGSGSGNWIGTLALMASGGIPSMALSLLAASSIRKPEESGEKLLLPGLGKIGVYYLLMSLFLEGKEEWIGILGYLPFFQALAMPMQHALGKGVLGMWLASMAYAWAALRLLGEKYRWRVLDRVRGLG